MRFVLLLLASVSAATAADNQDRGDWFKSLKRPDNGGSCCDITDCRRTRAEFIGGQWFAETPDGAVIAIPENKIVKSPRSIDGDAYLCSFGAMIYCFIEPWTGF